MTHIRLAIAVAGVLTWAYGTRIAHEGVQWLGIGVVAIAVLLRFARRHREPPTE